ncbi:hypothetical protein RvY_01311 [Ramazzottius varieornatus]|uniref:Uncharacterized protein n=1 Tax=Ramazzottius varieornatus TaxID=947166 RepID=A0A1D1UJG3_RAMVA|nr:hypothetical protein RvY_01311 [Ramazzottius varieornatus]
MNRKQELEFREILLFDSAYSFHRFEVEPVNHINATHAEQTSRFSCGASSATSFSSASHGRNSVEQYRSQTWRHPCLLLRRLRTSGPVFLSRLLVFDSTKITQVNHHSQIYQEKFAR